VKRLIWAAAGAAVLLALGACSAEDDLDEWMVEQHKEVHPNVPPIYPPKKFDPQAYAGVSGVEPFGQQKLVPAEVAVNTRPSALLAKAKSHAPEELEAYPLDAMTMVGTMNQGGKAHALVMVDGRLHDVKVGNYMGQNYGQVKSITDTAISLIETVQDATGEWVERTSTLQIQEKGR